MCGITGIWSFDGGREADMAAAVTEMASRIRHRGPDHAATWVDAHAGIALGFRRLSIIDLSTAGSQPMVSASGRYVIVFNGEIYNFPQLRELLVCEGTAPAWRGHSDTEVLLACIEAWGIERALAESNGMFAFAVWDTQERRLVLARDRAGEKPLYYCPGDRLFLFGSELHALEAHPRFDRNIDLEAGLLYAQFGYVPAPHTIYLGVRKLPPGTFLEVTDGGRMTETCYWNAATLAERAARERFRGSTHDAEDHLEFLLADSVRLRTAADVPLGVFLSGGIDSSLVVAMMQKHVSADTRTFTIGFEDSRFDETRFAVEIAKHLGTNQTTTCFTADDALALIPTVARAFDEPFADPSALPTHLLSATARTSVTVALGGDGADELFAGYHSHFLGRRLQRRVDLVPRPLRPMAARALELLSDSDRARHLAHALRLSDPIRGYYEKLSMPTLARAKPRLFRRPPPGIADPTEGVMFLDFAGYLPDDILVKVDRASMAVSLEVRAPFLDHRIIEFAWSLPLDMKIRADKGKVILRNLLARHLPAHLVGREKQGFGLPIKHWLRGPLRDWAEDLLDRRTLAETAIFDEELVAGLWRRHQDGEDHAISIWTVMMFEAWRRRTGASRTQ
ncbi:MAG: asparagine synthase (glutamine-hydrolyzing) [Thermoanaerobaculia bacterium]